MDIDTTNRMCLACNERHATRHDFCAFCDDDIASQIDMSRMEHAECLFDDPAEETDEEPADIDDDSHYDPYTGGWSDDC